MCDYKVNQISQVIKDVKANPNDGYNTAKIQISSDGAKTKFLNVSPKTLEGIKKLLAKET